jgi:hypothetical protein
LSFDVPEGLAREKRMLNTTKSDARVLFYKKVPQMESLVFAPSKVTERVPGIEGPDDSMRSAPPPRLER